MVAAERALEEDDPDKAHEHTKVARRFAARIGVVREAAGIVAYRAGHFSEALSDLRAARRMTGSDAYLAVMADCERGLGRPERALDLVRSPEAERLDRAGRIELSIVESGARRDLGQNDAAVITLQRLPELRDPQAKPWSARLAFAYADALADAGHQEAATDWFARAMAFDEDGETDAAERYAELTGAVIEDVEEEFDYEDDSDDAGTADQADAMVEVDEDVDEDAALAEADDLLDDSEPTVDQAADAEPVDQEEEPVGRLDADDEQDGSADRQGAQDGSADREDADDAQDGPAVEAESAPAQAESASEQEAAESRDLGDGSANAAKDVLKGTSKDASRDASKEAEPDELLDDDSGTVEPSAPASKVPVVETPMTLGISPAFIEPNFGDILDQPDEPAEDAAKRDSKRED
ncbi:MSCRAMM family adhesin SdrC [Nonomuraea aurantiaca]|uniref:MSCRAMM family adhesin SdrC n=1 Tax=Nonomuraea aurantiaca TaxID=2878562 RepID=UPI001CDA522D|nr:MSCRAMM family adhesin SdrC [Nonomuraea aurantiaca]MCA2230346.1 MSCRAMM family adhesin SdrC [Nonomuraea aurantiaca]